MIRIALRTIASVLLLGLVVRADTPATNAPTSDEAAAKAARAAAAQAAMAKDGCTVETFTVHSSAMDRDIKGLVILPPGYKENPDKKYPVLYAMHGSDAAFESFSKMVTLRAALKNEPMIVASFDGDSDSMYIDSPQPQQWSRDHKDTSLKKSLFTTFFFDDFVPYVDKTYRVNPKQRMLTGFSMGGFGAFHFMLTKPEMFASVSSMSGYFPVLTPPPADDDEGWGTLIGPYEQNKTQFAATDFYKRIQADVTQGVKLPPICLRCGTEDSLITDNRKMRDFLKSEGLACDYLESPGQHKWDYWKATATGIIDFHWKSLQSK